MKLKFIISLALLLILTGIAKTNAQSCHAVFADNDVLLAAVDNKLYRSTNGGTTFQHITMAGEDSNDVRCITRINNTLIAGAVNGLIRVFRSTDNGVTWTAANSGMPMIGSNHVAVPVNILTVGSRVFMGGTNFAKYSDDEGLTWADIPSVPTVSNAIKYTGNKLWHSSYSTVRYSSDNGATWTQTAANPFIGGGHAAGYAQFGDTLVVLGMQGAGQGVKRTVDNGATWTLIGDLSSGLDMIEVNGDLYATCFNGFMKSTDRGETWTQVCNLFQYTWDSYVGGMSLNSNIIWAAAQNGLIKYDLNTSTCALADVTATTSVKSVSLEDKIMLYPNPSKEFVRISGMVPDSKMTIVDVNGKLVYTSIVKTNDAVINTENFPDGIYLLLIENSGVRITKKLIVKR